MEKSPLRMLLLDMDGTLTTVTSPWQHVHQGLGVWDSKGKALLEQYLNREIGFTEFCERDVQIWNDLEIGLDEVHQILDRIPIPEETLTFLRAAHAAEFRLAIVSTGFTHTAERIRRLAELPEDALFVAANELATLPNGTIQAVLRVGDGSDVPGKAFWASHVIHRFGMTKEQVGAVGDTSADKPLFQAASVWTQVKGPADLAALTWLPFSTQTP